MPGKKTSPSPPKAVAGITAMRDTLAQDFPGYARAVEFEKEAEDFCRSIRADLRARRKQKNLDQAALGDRMDLTQSAVSKIEKGRGDVGLKTVYRYAEALGLRHVVLFVTSARSMVADTTEIFGVVDSLLSRRADPQGVAAAMEDAQVNLLRLMSSNVSDIMTGLVKKP